MIKITVRALRNERASVIVSGLVLVAVMTLLAAALFDLSLLGSRMFRDSASTAQALYCVEAGGARALAEIVPAPDDPLSWDGEPQSLPTPTGDCEYVATYANTANPKTLIATGTIGSVSRTLKWTAESSSQYAILIGGNFEISGNPTVGGECGNVHTNSDLIISGSPIIAGAATATGTYTVTGNPTVGEGIEGGQAPKPVPDIDPAQYLIAAKVISNVVFQLMSNGQILDGDDALITTVGAGEEFQGWVYNRQNKPWDYAGSSDPVDGAYYLEGSAKISGNPGNEATPWVTTIIAEGDIEITGNPNMEPRFADALLVAGLDIKIDGNPSLVSLLKGSISVHEQIQIIGNPTIFGNIVAEDASSTGRLVRDSIIEGNPSITPNCASNSTGGLTWKWGECADPSCGT